MSFPPSFFDHLSDRLELAVYDTNQELKTRRLTALLDELTPMKFKITEPVFFLGKQRQPGEEMEAPVGPYRQQVVPGGLKNIPQFVELPQAARAAPGIKMSDTPPLPNTTPMAPVAVKPATNTPKLNGLHGAFAGFTQRVESMADKLHKRMESVGDFTENAVGKFSGGIDKIEATAKSIDDAANQMSNGGPPLGN